VDDALRAKADDLRDSIELVLRDLERLGEEIGRAHVRISAGSEQLELYGAGALAHGYYTHLERAFERVARDLNSAPLAGPDWHRRLLQAMTLDKPGIRPALLSVELAERLDELLRFRHLFRNMYVLNLDGARIVAVLERALSVRAPVRDALQRFSGFLEQVSQSGRP
jgi:hypothetical protein